MIIRLVEALNTINEFTRQKIHTKAVNKHIEMVVRLGKETIKEKRDLNDLDKRANSITER